MWAHCVPFDRHFSSYEAYIWTRSTSQTAQTATKDAKISRLLLHLLPLEERKAYGTAHPHSPSNTRARVLYLFLCSNQWLTAVFTQHTVNTVKPRWNTVRETNSTPDVTQHPDAWKMETESVCDHTRQVGSDLDHTSHGEKLPGQTAISLLREVSCWAVTHEIFSFWCHDVIFMLRAFCMTAAYSERLAELTGEVWPAWTLSARCWCELYLTSACTASLWDSTPLNTLW